MPMEHIHMNFQDKDALHWLHQGVLESHQKARNVPGELRGPPGNSRKCPGDPGRLGDFGEPKSPQNGPAALS